MIPLLKKITITAAVFGLTAIVLGAFGAHALKKVLSLEQLSTFETGVKYQMYHALFLLFLGSTNLIENKVKKVVFYTVVTGVFLFSGSIYILATNNLTGISFKPIGILTPIGGLFLIAGWGLIIVNLIKNKS
jgi:uncharacterized membrane protein YgdD (TMEM256/DUF423 family)